MSAATEVAVTGDNRLNLGCGEDYRDGWHNVDVVEAVDPDEVVDLSEFPWPWADGEFSYVLASHVLEHLPTERALRECVRICEPNGFIDIRLPIGLDALADPDHTGETWTWITPEMYCGSRHWDSDLGLAVAHRDVTLWSQLPGDWAHEYQEWLDGLLDEHGPGRWCFTMPAVSGEFEVVFRCQ
jgi:SAM-dependent methyltransferase